MGDIRRPDKVLLFVGVLYTDADVLNKAVAALKHRYGGTCLEHTGIAFESTDFYDDEMGKGIKKAFFFFEELIDPEHIAAIKNETNVMEEYFSATDGRRTVNLDPGYLDMAKVILVTTKDRGHRIYLQRGIFAETELIYFRKKYETMPWTYPDYKKDDYIGIFTEARLLYNNKRKISP